MKDIVKVAQLFLGACCFLFLVSCQSEDDTVATTPEIPDWLKARIDNHEATIATDSTLWPIYGAWAQYQFQKSIYFEYENPVSSLSFLGFTEEGSPIDLATPFYTNYQRGKCCKQYVWKAPKHLRLE